MDISRFLHWIQPERLYMSVDVMVKGKRGLPAIPNWNDIPEKLENMKAFLVEKYGENLPKWDPMSAWAE